MLDSVLTIKDFFKWVQGQWRDKYSKDRKARDDVLAKSIGVHQGMHNADEKADRTVTSGDWMNLNRSGRTYLIMVTTISVNFVIDMFANLRQIGYTTYKRFILTIQRERRLSPQTLNSRLHLNPLTCVHTLAVAIYSAPTDYPLTVSRVYML